jgi:hypothetical protein
LVDKHVNTEEQDVFSCDYDTCGRLSVRQRNQFIRLEGTEDSYTDQNRMLQNICQDFNNETEVIDIEKTLRTTLNVQDHNIEEPVLLTTTKKKSSYKIHRQKLHKDFKEGDSSIFVIIALCDKQNIYIELNGTISSIELPKDCAFVGHASLIHAGSERPGKRLHFKLVSKSQVEEDTKTYFVKDSLYPGNSGILK